MVHQAVSFRGKQALSGYVSKHKYTPVLIDETYEVDVDFIFQN